MTAKFKDIIPGEKMTKEWRIRIIGVESQWGERPHQKQKNGKECA